MNNIINTYGISALQFTADFNDDGSKKAVRVTLPWPEKCIIDDYVLEVLRPPYMERISSNKITFHVSNGEATYILIGESLSGVSTVWGRVR